MQYLEPGDHIGLISTARHITLGEILPALDWLKKKGFKPVYNKSAFEQYHQFAGNDATRAEYFQFLLNHPDVKAIWCLRGGYGSVRILDKVNFEDFVSSEKILIGYSDVTAIHSHLWTKYNHAGVHATMPINVKMESTFEQEESLKTLLNSIVGKQLSYQLTNHPLNKFGNAKGILIGGNLSIIYSLLGSESSFNTDGCILFLEDLDEYLYHIDRMMMALKRAGKLDKIKALVVGGMTKMNDNAVPFGKTAEEIIFEHTHEFSYPIYFGLSSGHTSLNFALRLGKIAELKDNNLILHP